MPIHRPLCEILLYGLCYRVRVIYIQYIMHACMTCIQAYHSLSRFQHSRKDAGGEEDSSEDFKGGCNSFSLQHLKIKLISDWNLI